MQNYLSNLQNKIDENIEKIKSDIKESGIDGIQGYLDGMIDEELDGHIGTIAVAMVDTPSLFFAPMGMHTNLYEAIQYLAHDFLLDNLELYLKEKYEIKI